MLDISQARRLTTIAKKRIEEQDELEYEVLSEWEQRAIEFMSDPYLHDILMEFVDGVIADHANQGESSGLITYGMGKSSYVTRIRGDNNEVLYRTGEFFGENHWIMEINALIDTYDFMSTSDTDTILQVLWETLSEIIIPVYEESYTVERNSLEHWICISW